MTRSTRLAWTAAAIVMIGAAGLASTTLLGDDAGVQLGDVVGMVVLIGGHPAIATWLIVRHVATEGLRSACGALRTGWTGAGLLVAGFVGAGLAATTLVSSRASLTGDRTGSLILNGDAPVEAPTDRGGALDALRSTLIFGPITWLPWPVIGAALGAALRRWSSIVKT